MEIFIQDNEIFKQYTYEPFINNGKEYLLSSEPYLDIVLTEKCNTKCSFCCYDLKNRQVLNYKKAVEKIMYAVSNLNVKEVMLTGGDPTCSDELFRFIDFLGSIGLNKICLKTNGLKLKDIKFLSKIAKSKLSHINISLINIEPDLAAKFSANKDYLEVNNIANIFSVLKDNGIKLRMNALVFKGNLDNKLTMLYYYYDLKDYCDSIMFSPLIVPNIDMVSNTVYEWCNKNAFNNINILFDEFESEFDKITTIRNDKTLGYAKYSFIPMKTPIILNWNQCETMGSNSKFINHIKLLANGELSLSWDKNKTDNYLIIE